MKITFETIGISHVPRCFGNSAAMAIRVKLNDSFVLSPIESAFAMELS